MTQAATLAVSSGGAITMAGLILLNVVAVMLYARWVRNRKRGK